MDTITINNETLRFNDPIKLLNCWKTLNLDQKKQLKDSYLSYWQSDDNYIDDLFEGISKKTKEVHWHYWWRTIEILEDPLTCQKWLDKWYHAIELARSKRDIKIENELLSNISFWNWPHDKEKFYLDASTLFIMDFKESNGYKSGLNPFNYYLQWPGVGSASFAWKDIIKTFNHVGLGKFNTSLSLINQAKLWLVTEAYDFKTKNGLDTAPDNIIFFTQYPAAWSKLKEDDISVADIWRYFDSLPKG